MMRVPNIADDDRSLRRRPQHRRGAGLEAIAVDSILDLDAIALLELEEVFVLGGRERGESECGNQRIAVHGCVLASLAPVRRTGADMVPMGTTFFGAWRPPRFYEPGLNESTLSLNCAEIKHACYFPSAPNTRTPAFCNAGNCVERASADSGLPLRYKRR